MIDTGLLLTVLAAELIILALLLGLLVARSLRLALTEPGRKRRIKRAAMDLIETIQAGRNSSLRFSELRTADQVEVLFDLLPNLSGEARRQLSAIAIENGLDGSARRWCDSRRWFVRLRGTAVFAVLGEKGPVLEMLEDDKPEVRIRAVELVAAGPGRPELEKLCLMLHDPDPGVRFGVTDALLRAGGEVVEPLARTIEHDPDPQSVEAALRVASGIGDSRLATLAIFHCRADHPGVRAAAAAACGSVGGSAATEVLGSMLKDTDPGVRKEAVDALGRMNSWSSAPGITELLDDEDWPVRRSAAVVLQGFGPLGRLYLRRAAREERGPASQIAAQALGTPAMAGGD